MNTPRAWLFIPFLLLLSGQAVAQRSLTPLDGGLLLGPFVGHVELENQIGYETNVFRTATNPQADIYSSITPKLELGLDRERSEFLIDSSFRDLRYYGARDPVTLRQSDQTWVFSGMFAQELRSGTKFELDGRFMRTSDPLFADLTLNADRIDRDASGLGIKIEQLTGTGTLSFLLEYDYTQQKFDAAFDDFNRQHHRLLAGVDMRIFTTLSVYVNAGYSAIRRPQLQTQQLSLQQDEGSIVTGVKGSPTPLYSVEAKLGLTYRALSQFENQLRAIAELITEFNLSPQAKLRAAYQYESLAGFTTDELTINKASLLLLYMLGTNWETVLGGEVWRTLFSPTAQATRDDLSWKVLGRIEYKPDGLAFLSVAGEYNYLGRNSNDAFFDFHSHVAMLTVLLRY